MTDVPISVRIPQDLWKYLQREARKRDRTAPSLLREIIRKWKAWNDKRVAADLAERKRRNEAQQGAATP